MNFPLRESIYIERPVRFRGCIPSACNIVPHFHMPNTQCPAPFSILSWSSIVGKRQSLDRSYRRGILVARLRCGEEARSPILDCLHKCSGYWNSNKAVFGGRRPCFRQSLVDVQPFRTELWCFHRRVVCFHLFADPSSWRDKANVLKEPDNCLTSHIY